MMNFDEFLEAAKDRVQETVSDAEVKIQQVNKLQVVSIPFTDKPIEYGLPQMAIQRQSFYGFMFFPYDLHYCCS